jgi:predicted RNA-binding protein with PIN domain
MMQGDLSTARDVLLRDLGEYAKHRGVLVVAAVDAIGGPAQGVVEEKLITGVIVAYCGDQEADSYIQSQVKVWLDRGHPQVIVATNDNLQRISIDGTVSHRQRVRESESESDGDEMGDDSSAHGEEEEIEKDYPINGNVVPQQRQQREEEEEENIEDRSSLIDDRLVWVVPVATLLREIQCAKESIQAVIAENNLKPAMLTLSRSSQLLQLRNAMVQSNKEEAAAAAAGSRSRNGKNSNIDEKKPDQKQQ